ncbi:hypothetical protein SALBM311S_02560 [Streptomyces alboniger]
MARPRRIVLVRHGESTGLVLGTTAIARWTGPSNAGGTRNRTESPEAPRAMTADFPPEGRLERALASRGPACGGRAGLAVLRARQPPVAEGPRAAARTLAVDRRHGNGAFRGRGSSPATSASTRTPWPAPSPSTTTSTAGTVPLSTDCCGWSEKAVTGASWPPRSSTDRGRGATAPRCASHLWVPVRGGPRAGGPPGGDPPRPTRRISTVRPWSVPWPSPRLPRWSLPRNADSRDAPRRRHRAGPEECCRCGSATGPGHARLRGPRHRRGCTGLWAAHLGSRHRTLRPLVGGTVSSGTTSRRSGRPRKSAATWTRPAPSWAE